MNSQTISKPKLAVLISGRGSNLSALANAIGNKQLNAEIVCVVSNISTAEGLQKATTYKLPTQIIPHIGITREEHAQNLIEVLAPLDPSLICLAGYMRILAPSFLDFFKNKVINIHPSLLPAFPGLRAQAQALEYGVKFSGCTVHLVDAQLDHGPIISQAVVPVLSNDTEETLSARILEQEHKLYPATVEMLLHKTWEIQNHRVIFLDSPDNF